MQEGVRYVFLTLGTLGAALCSLHGGHISIAHMRVREEIRLVRILKALDNPVGGSMAPDLDLVVGLNATIAFCVKRAMHPMSRRVQGLRCEKRSTQQSDPAKLL